MSNWQFDTAKTQERYDRLQEYYQRTGLNADNFFCQHYGACSGSQKDGTVKQYSGGTAGLSPFFDVSYAGQPIRILIMAKKLLINLIINLAQLQILILDQSNA